MTKKHYKLIASAIEPWVRFGTLEAGIVARSIATTMCAKFQADNDKFDRDKFMRACGFSDDGN